MTWSARLPDSTILTFFHNFQSWIKNYSKGALLLTELCHLILHILGELFIDKKSELIWNVGVFVIRAQIHCVNWTLDSGGYPAQDAAVAYWAGSEWGLVHVFSYHHSLCFYFRWWWDEKADEVVFVSSTPAIISSSDSDDDDIVVIAHTTSHNKPQLKEEKTEQAVQSILGTESNNGKSNSSSVKVHPFIEGRINLQKELQLKLMMKMTFSRQFVPSRQILSK